MIFVQTVAQTTYFSTLVLYICRHAGGGGGLIAFTRLKTGSEPIRQTPIFLVLMNK